MRIEKEATDSPVEATRALVLRVFLPYLSILSVKCIWRQSAFAHSNVRSCDGLLSSLVVGYKLGSMPKVKTTPLPGFHSRIAQEDVAKGDDHEDTPLAGPPSQNSKRNDADTAKKAESTSRATAKRARGAKRRAEGDTLSAEEGRDVGSADPSFEQGELPTATKKRAPPTSDNDYSTSRDHPIRSNAIEGAGIITNLWKPGLPSDAVVPPPTPDANADLWTSEGFTQGKRPLVFRTGWPKSKPIDGSPNAPFLTHTMQYRVDPSPPHSISPIPATSGPNEMMMDFSLRYKSEDLTFKSGLPKAIQKAVEAEAAAAAAAAAAAQASSAPLARGPGHAENGNNADKPLEIINTIVTHITPSHRTNRNGSTAPSVHFWHDTTPATLSGAAESSDMSPNLELYNHDPNEVSHDLGHVSEAPATHTFVNIPFNNPTGAGTSSMSTYDFVSFEAPDMRKRRNGTPGDEEGAPPTGRGRRRSPIWSNFARIGTKFVCQLCKPSNANQFSPSVTTRTLRRHITSAHPEVAEEYGFIQPIDRSAEGALEPGYDVDAEAAMEHHAHEHHEDAVEEADAGEDTSEDSLNS